LQGRIEAAAPVSALPLVRGDTTLFLAAFGADVPCLSPENDPMKQAETDLTIVTSETGH
jgi:hypothetical protein